MFQVTRFPTDVIVTTGGKTLSHSVSPQDPERYVAMLANALPALEAGPDDLLQADAFILGTPENFGYMSGAMKYFLDRVYYPCEGKEAGKPYALFVRAGNDGSGAITSLRRILTGLAVREVQEPVLIAGEFDADRLAECEDLGLTMAAGLEAGVF